MKFFSNLSGSVAGESYEFDTETPIAAILFNFVFSGAEIVAFPNTLDAIFDGMSISASITNLKGSGNKRIYNNVPLSAVAEFQSYREGAIEVVLNAAGDGVTGVNFTVPISPDGSLAISNNATLEVTLNGLPASADFTMSAYGIETGTSDFEIIDFQSLGVPDNRSESPFQLSGLETLVLPISADFQDIEMHYSNGDTVVYTPAELRALSFSSNDATFVASNGYVCAGACDYYIFPVESAVKCVISTNNNGYSFYGVAHLPILDDKDVRAKNARIGSTSAPLRLERIKAVRKQVA